MWTHDLSQHRMNSEWLLWDLNISYRKVMNLRPLRKAPEARLLLNLLQGLFIIIIITKEA